MICAVIFDFDDTLIDNSRLDYEGFLRPCEKLGIPIPTYEKITNFRKNGLLAKDIAIKLKNDTSSKFSISQFLEFRNTFLQSSDSIQFLTLRVGTTNLLAFLKSKKIKCFICSVRKNKNIIKKFLTKNLINQYFSGVYLMEDLGLNIDNNSSSNRVLIKNSLIHTIIKSHSILARNIMFIGNSKDDYESSLNMHVKFIYYEDSYNNFQFKNTIKVKNMPNLQQKLVTVFKNI